MPLTGDAKTAYQREYMRRRRSASAAKSIEETRSNSGLTWSPENEAIWIGEIAAHEAALHLGLPEPEQVTHDQFRDRTIHMAAAIMAFLDWLPKAHLDTITAHTVELMEDVEHWDREWEEETLKQPE